MKYGYLQNFKSLDPRQFEVFIRHLGFASAAFYHVRGGKLIRALCTEVEPPMPWPLVVPMSSYYTSTTPSLPPVGWCRPSFQSRERKDWPKGTILYFPEQELADVRIVFAVTTAVGRRVRIGELHGAFEALANRIRQMSAIDRRRAELSEGGLQEYVLQQALGRDLQTLLDHEIRTPLASIAGYTALLRGGRGDGMTRDSTQFIEQEEQWHIVEKQLASALDAIDRLSLALAAGRSGVRSELDEDVIAIDIEKELLDICRDAKLQAEELIGPEAAKDVHIRFRKDSDAVLRVMARRRLFRWALWEVVKNAVIHARSGRVDVNAYATNGMLVIDIADDGMGLANGSEELVFLRFYQDPSTQIPRRAKRGLGLGLFLARHIAQRHLGELSYLRHPSSGMTVFRFIWPLEKADDKSDTWQKGA